MDNYEEKKQARINRLKDAADRAENRASEYFEAADKMVSAIPFGQPILVGHHSEKQDRNYRNKIESKFNKAIESYDYAKDLRRMAEAAEKNTAISSDDPDAVKKLTEKLEILQKYQTEMKSMNNYYRKNGTCKGYKNLSDDEAIKIDTQIENGYSWEKQPFPGWELSNNNANIRRIKERIEDLTRVHEKKYESIGFEGGRIVVNKEINRLQIFFDDIPDSEIRGEMKSRGFKFSKYNNNAWQRQLNDNAVYAAKKVVEKFEKIHNEQDSGPNMSM